MNFFLHQNVKKKKHYNTVILLAKCENHNEKHYFSLWFSHFKMKLRNIMTVQPFKSMDLQD